MTDQSQVRLEFEDNFLPNRRRLGKEILGSECLFVLILVQEIGKSLREDLDKNLTKRHRALVQIVQINR